MTVRTTRAPAHGTVKAELQDWSDVTNDIADGAHPSGTAFPSSAPFGAIWFVDGKPYACTNTSGCTTSGDWEEMPAGAQAVLDLLKTVDGPGSGLDADMLHGADYKYYTSTHYVGFYVDGDADTYYPVRINPVSWSWQYGFYPISISRWYKDEAPDSWGPDSNHHGGLTFTFLWSGDRLWGGNDHAVRAVEFSESYTTIMAKWALSTNGVIVWLRGGHAYYRLHTPEGLNAIATVYLNGYTDDGGNTYNPTTTVDQSGIYYNYPVRGNGALYEFNRKVLTSAQGYARIETATGSCCRSSEGWCTASVSWANAFSSIANVVTHVGYSDRSDNNSNKDVSMSTTGASVQIFIQNPGGTRCAYVHFLGIGT